jgi:hypothetical protein
VSQQLWYFEKFARTRAAVALHSPSGGGRERVRRGRQAGGTGQREGEGKEVGGQVGGWACRRGWTGNGCAEGSVAWAD